MATWLALGHDIVSHSELYHSITECWICSHQVSYFGVNTSLVALKTEKFHSALPHEIYSQLSLPVFTATLVVFIIYPCYITTTHFTNAGTENRRGSGCGGGDFIPLVVECLEVWTPWGTPYALSIELFSIQLATHSGISYKMARSLLPVKAWYISQQC